MPDDVKLYKDYFLLNYNDNTVNIIFGHSKLLNYLSELLTFLNYFRYFLQLKFSKVTIERDNKKIIILLTNFYFVLILRYIFNYHFKFEKDVKQTNKNIN